MTLRVLCVAAVAAFAAGFAQAEVRLAGVFQNHMVLQRGMEVPVWGWADPGEKVSVSFAGQTKEATAGDDGKWMVRLDAMEASKEGRELKAGNLVRKDVLVGEVWICSGQSNMEWGVNRTMSRRSAPEMAEKLPTIRLLTTPRKALFRPQIDDQSLRWQICSSKTIQGFSAVGFHFGRRIVEEVDVPVGLINSSWGGTKVEPWTNPEGFAMVPELKPISDNLAKEDPATEEGKAAAMKTVEGVKAWTAKAEAAIAGGKALPPAPKFPNPKVGHQDPTRIYNAKIYPLIPYAVRGAIWYQGESNGGEGESYFHKKQALIKGWRKVWGQDMSFYFVQLTAFQKDNKNPAGGDGWSKHREAQRKTLTVPDTGMAVIIDIGNARDIHPQNKKDVGERLANWALAKNYGQKDLVYSGPLYKSHKVEGNSIVLEFDHVGSGLMVGAKKGRDATTEVADGELQRFAIAGADKKWHWAKAVIKDGTVVVSAEAVTEPVAVRYAFSMNPAGCNLYNKEGLPASPFRTDDW